MNWIFENTEVTEDILPEGAVGFVYKIIHIPTGKFYIGKKNLSKVRNVKLGKRELALIKEARKKEGKGGRLPSKKKVISNSDWNDYYSSNDEIKEMVKAGKSDEFRREVIKFCNSLKSLGYWETYYLFKYDVLESDSCFNSNILGKYYKRDLI